MARGGKRAKPVVGLVMLVRDEVETLPTLIESARPLIGSWTICDTGSLDGSQDLIRETLKDLPGSLHERPWVGFAHNRTELLRLARGSADYLLMLDADHILHQHGDLPDLTADEYQIRIAGGFEWWLPLLLKDGHDWEYRGVVHSYLHAPGPVTVAKLPELSITSQRKNSPREDKIERDAELLESEIDPRTIFYLAQTYKDLGHLRESADLYRFRVRHSASNPEERFWACFEEAKLRQQTEGFARAVPIYLEAWQRRPTRAEPLHALARQYRAEGSNELALFFAEAACRLPRPADSGFLLSWVYEWGARQERALSLRALGRNEEALHEFEELAALAIEGEPGRFFVEQIADLKGQTAVFPPAVLEPLDLPPLILPADDGWMLPPDMLGKLMALVRETKPVLVVECGSGASTVALAAALRDQGGRLGARGPEQFGRVVALEHDPRFRARTIGMLQDNGLAEFAEVRLAPLTQLESWQWYAREAWDDLNEIGLLIVDGPPGITARLARYPALPLLRDRLLPGTPILLDDCDRPDERSTLARWQTELKLAPPLLVSHSKANAALLYSANGQHT